VKVTGKMNGQDISGVGFGEGTGYAVSLLLAYFLLIAIWRFFKAITKKNK
jgi:hypothetical protein